MSWMATENDSKTAPWKSFAEVEDIYSKWRRKDMFRHLTEDQLFSAVYLRGLYRESDFRNRIISKVTDYIRDHNKKNEDQTDNLDIFAFIKEEVAQERDNSIFSSIGGKKDVNTNRHGAADWYIRKENYTEIAAVSEEASAANEDLLAGLRKCKY